MKNYRPQAVANIYKHGRLKTAKEMAEDGTSKPVQKELIDKCKSLTDGVEVDLDNPLNPDD